MAAISKYETVFIVNATLPEEDITAIVAKFKALIEANATAVDSFDEWGKRRLAYPIEDLTEGYYVLSTYSSPAAFPAELDRNFNITDGIIRSLTINKDEK